MKKFLATTIKLLYFNTYSGNEAIMKGYILRKLFELGFTSKIDDVGNIYAIRGESDKYPLLNAHMDIVSSYSSAKIKVPSQKVKSIVTPASGIIKDTVKAKHCSDCKEYYNCIREHQANSNLDRSPQMTWNEASTEIDEINFAKTCTQFIKDTSVSTYGGLSSYYDDDYDDYKYGYQTSLYNNSYTYVKPLTTPEERIDIDKQIKEKFKILYAEKTKLISSNGIRILGGDDKCGISIALQVARENKNIPMKLLFTVQEEHGCVGMKHFEKHNAKWLENVKYSITIDRRGGDNLLIWSGSKRNCSNEFAGECTKHALNAGIVPKIENGGVADVMILRDYCEAVNISAGYYGAHTLQETVKFDEMILIRKWVSNIVKNM